jgi:hypothetical protein
VPLNPSNFEEWGTEVKKRVFEDFPDRKEKGMELGAFSMSLAVNDIEASRKFYEKFGFKVFAGDASQNWLILKKRFLTHSDGQLLIG